MWGMRKRIYFPACHGGKRNSVEADPKCVRGQIESDKAKRLYEWKKVQMSLDCRTTQPASNTTVDRLYLSLKTHKDKNQKKKQSLSQRPARTLCRSLLYYVVAEPIASAHVYNLSQPHIIWFDLWLKLTPIFYSYICQYILKLKHISYVS